MDESPASLEFPETTSEKDGELPTPVIAVFGTFDLAIRVRDASLALIPCSLGENFENLSEYEKRTSISRELVP